MWFMAVVLVSLCDTLAMWPPLLMPTLHFVIFVIKLEKRCLIKVFVFRILLLVYVYDKHIRSCRNHTFSGQA